MASESHIRDRKLLDELSRGNASAFWTIWQNHAPHLRAVCHRHMQRVVPEAEDAVSRSMMIALQKLPKYANEIVDLEAWLTRLTSNVCLDIKKERCRGARRVDPLEDTILARRESTLLDPPTPEEACLAAQVREQINFAFAQLPPILGAVAKMRFLQEASYTTIAEQLSITETAARKRVQKARMVLRCHLNTLSVSALLG
jgi:RNA polymerase sigma factor (sigma-70 family)